MLDIVHELSLTIQDLFDPDDIPYLIADMPCGSASHIDIALQNAEMMIQYGADAIKLEVESDKTFDIIEDMAENDFIVVAHIGYTPQYGGSKKRGSSFQDAQQMFHQARRARDSGASVLVLEGVSSVVNQALSAHNVNSLPVYSIFSGKALNGGQSINVWDSVYKPPFKSKFFPKTASLDSSSYPSTYSLQIISDHIKNLLIDLWGGTYPDDRTCIMNDEERTIVANLNPWVS